MLPSSALALVYILMAAPAAPAVGPGGSGASTVPSSPQPGATPSPEEVRSAAAKQLYSEQRYVESARAYEALYSEFGDPKYLFNAAAAHEGAGQDAHAYVALRRFLDHPGLSAEDQARGEARLAPLRRRTVPLQLEIVPSPRPAGLELELRRPGIGPLRLGTDALAALDRRGVIELRAESGGWSVGVQAPGYHKLETALQPSTEGGRALLKLDPVAIDAAPTPGLVAVTATFEPAEAVSAGIDVKLEGPRPQFKRVQSSPASWELSPGDWTLDASAPNYRPAHLSFVAGAQGVPLTVRLEPAQRRRPAVIALGALAGTGIVAGTIVAAVYAKRFQQRWDEATEPTSTEKVEISRVEGKNLRSEWGPYLGGTAVIGVGIGLGMGAITTVFEHRSRRPARIWAAEMLAGGSLVALGFSLSSLLRAEASRVLQTRGYCDGICNDLPHQLRLDGLANFTGGIGVGLAASGLVGLARLAWRGKKSRVGRTVAAGSYGITISF